MSGLDYNRTKKMDGIATFKNGDERKIYAREIMHTIRENKRVLLVGFLPASWWHYNFITNFEFLKKIAPSN